MFARIPTERIKIHSKLQMYLASDKVPNAAHVLQILTLALAVKKMSKILSDPFPVLDSTNSAPDANTNGRPLSLAIARASNVFPVPGGPLIKIPCQSLKTHIHQALQICKEELQFISDRRIHVRLRNLKEKDCNMTRKDLFIKLIQRFSSSV